MGRPRDRLVGDLRPGASRAGWRWSAEIAPPRCWSSRRTPTCRRARPCLGTHPRRRAGRGERPELRRRNGDRARPAVPGPRPRARPARSRCADARRRCDGMGRAAAKCGRGRGRARPGLRGRDVPSPGPGRRSVRSHSPNERSRCSRTTPRRSWPSSGARGSRRRPRTSLGRLGRSRR